MTSISQKLKINT